MVASSPENLGLVSQRMLTLAPVTRLPSDVILSVFFYLRDAHIKCRRPVWDWMTVTWICKRWRAVALECRSLWSEVRLFRQAGRTRLGLFLDRSGSAYINVDIDTGYTRDHAQDVALCSVLFKGHLWRVRDLEISLVDWRWNEILPGLVKITHRVKTLKLQYMAWRNEGPIPQNDMLSDLLVPDKFPGVQLQSLSLSFVCIPWSCSLYCGLSDLNIENLKSRPTLAQFINILKNCPNLRTLKLVNFWPIVPGTQHVDRKLVLPNLSTILLFGIHYSFCLALFNIVQGTRHMLLDISLSHQDDNEAGLVPVWLPSKIFDTQNECFNISIRLSLKTFTIKSKCSIDDCAMMSDTTISLQMHPSSPDHHVANAVSNILADPFWQTAKSVVLSFDNAFLYLKSTSDTLSWNILLNGLPSRTKRLALIINEYSGQEFRTAVAEALSTPVPLSDTESRYCLPALEEMTVYHPALSGEHGRKTREIFNEHIGKRNNSTKNYCNMLYAKY